MNVPTELYCEIPVKVMERAMLCTIFVIHMRLRSTSSVLSLKFSQSRSFLITKCQIIEIFKSVRQAPNNCVKHSGGWMEVKENDIFLTFKLTEQ